MPSKIWVTYKETYDNEYSEVVFDRGDVAGYSVFDIRFLLDAGAARPDQANVRPKS